MKSKIIVLGIIIAGFLLGGCKASMSDVSEAAVSSSETVTSSETVNVSSEAPETYTVRSTEIKIGDDPFKLDGILCFPEGVQNPPVVIMVQGSGQSDYDETISVNKPFRDIANGLAEHGIASIRYNKRYYQYGDTAIERLKTVTIQDEITDDIGFAITYAKENEATKNSRIYILGHSLGGMLAPYIASIYPDAAGIIIMAGTPRHLEDVLLDQNKVAIKKLTDKTDSEKQKMVEEIEKYVSMVKNLKEGDPSIFLFGCPTSYWLSLNKIDTPKIVKELEIPIMVLQGSADFQVYPEIDYKAWQDILSGKQNATFKLYENLNHLFIKSNGKEDTTEYDIKGNVEPKVIKDVAEWIKNNG